MRCLQSTWWLMGRKEGECLKETTDHTFKNKKILYRNDGFSAKGGNGSVGGILIYPPATLLLAITRGRIVHMQRKMTCRVGVVAQVLAWSCQVVCLPCVRA